MDARVSPVLPSKLTIEFQLLVFDYRLIGKSMPHCLELSMNRNGLQLIVEVRICSNFCSSLAETASNWADISKGWLLSVIEVSSFVTRSGRIQPNSAFFWMVKRNQLDTLDFYSQASRRVSQSTLANRRITLTGGAVSCSCKSKTCGSVPDIPSRE